MKNFFDEGAELNCYCNGESYSVPLSGTQLAVIVKILGLKFSRQGEIACYSDATLKQFTTMSGNPLRLEEKQ